ncbi:uncharacterized mitochondrial protein AtMg00240-like [Eucalyptus grandis]|uniref:uncharacterized mitochondrial protein AtMg00240-like n=1 Tax=Eucalyptus grandis TaxID=71139 RepID=UPI00192EF510|nr:uncharacterized mitochondrial protein AtMg00240-like [Eucalyptus grandis]
MTPPRRSGRTIRPPTWTKDYIYATHSPGLSGCRPAVIPIEQNTKLTTSEYDRSVSQNDDPILKDPSGYQRLVGKLIYLTMTRPDISYAVQTLSQFMHSPKRSHLEAALKVVKYLKRCPGLGILLSKQCDMKMRASCDADYATCPTSRRSILWILFASN